MMLLMNKPLFAICQKCIIFHFTANDPSNSCSMSVRLLKAVFVMVLRGVGVAVLQNYENRSVHNLLKIGFLHHLKNKKAWTLGSFFEKNLPR